MSGLSLGPVYQAFDSSGILVATQVVLNPDFTVDNGCLGTNLDGVAGNEVIVGGERLLAWPGGRRFTYRTRTEIIYFKPSSC